MKSLAVLVPLNWSHVHTLFFMSWTRMLSGVLSDFDVELFVSNQSLIDKMRESLAKQAKKSGADYILWLDADQIYPEDTITRLAGRIDDEHLIVGGVTPKKRDGGQLVYKFYNDEGLAVFDEDFQLRQGLQKVDAMGMGGIMMSRKIFDYLEEPYFLRKWSYETDTLIGEDLCFYNRCRKAGVDVWCDSDLLYGHIVNYVVTLEDKDDLT